MKPHFRPNSDRFESTARFSSLGGSRHTASISDFQHVNYGYGVRGMRRATEAQEQRTLQNGLPRGRSRLVAVVQPMVNYWPLSMQNCRTPSKNNAKLLAAARGRSDGWQLSSPRAVARRVVQKTASQPPWLAGVYSVDSLTIAFLSPTRAVRFNRQAEHNGSQAAILLSCRAPMREVRRGAGTIENPTRKSRDIHQN